MTHVKRIIPILVILMLWGTFASAIGADDKGATFYVDPKLQPELTALSDLPGDIPRPIFAVRNPDGTVEQIVVDELIVRTKDDKELGALLERYDGQLLHDGSIPPPPKEIPANRTRNVEPSPFKLVRLNLDKIDTSLMEKDAATLGIKGEFAVSSKDGLKLLAAMMRTNIEGIHAEPEMPEFPHLVEHPIAGGGNLDPEAGCTATQFAEVCDTTVQATRINKAWEYVRTLNVTYSPFIAIVDDGFALDGNGNPRFGNLDLPTNPIRWNFNTDTNNISGPGWNCTQSTANAGTCWHGTAVANVATATANNSFGTAAMGWNSQPFLFKRTSRSQTGRAFRTAVAWGADVINASLGANCNFWCREFGISDGDYPGASNAAASAGVPLVASAGNNAIDVDQNHIRPCRLSAVICVGALAYNSQFAATAAQWGTGQGSNFGASVDIWASGDNVPVAPLPMFTTANGWTGINAPGFNTLTQMDGTSFSSPTIAGVAAMMKSVDMIDGTQDLRFVDFRSIMISTANTSPDPLVSPTGIVDAYAAVLEAANFRPAGSVSSPATGTDWLGSVPLSVTLCSVCTADHVWYYARYDAGNGYGVHEHKIAESGTSPDFPATWDITGVPVQGDVEVWAILFPANSIWNTRTLENTTIGLNIDTIPPTGQITSPVANQTYGFSMDISAVVNDNFSGVSHVDFAVFSAGGTVMFAGTGTPQNNFTVTWNNGNYPSQTVSVNARVYDNVGNWADLAPVSSVHLDHSNPIVTMYQPSNDALNPVWITSTGATLVIAEAEDPSGISEVRFSAWYSDDDGDYYEHQLGADSIPDAFGRYSLTFDVSDIPDQADRTFPFDLYIEATAIDTFGNASATDLGWIIGYDRTAPQVNITSPASSMTVQGGQLNIDVDTTDNLGIVGRVDELVISATYKETAQSSPSEHVLATWNDVTNGTASLNLDVLPEQIVTIIARATDEAGNWNTAQRTIVIDRSAPMAANVSHSPDPFITNGSRFMGISYTLTDWASALTIVILDSRGAPVHDLVYTNVNTDPKVATWDARDKYGSLVPSDTYEYEFHITDAAGNTTVQSGNAFEVIVDTTAPRVELYVDSRFYLSSGNPLEIVYGVDEDARVEIEIVDAGGSMVKYLGSWDVKSGKHNAYWDGTDFSGNKVPTPDSYTVRVRATDLAANVSAETSNVFVDR